MIAIKKPDCQRPGSACLLLLAMAFAVHFLVSGAAYAQSNDGSASAESPDDIQPKVIEEMKRMAAFLRGLDQFRLTAHTVHDDVLAGDLKVEISSVATYLVRPPDRMRLDLISDQQARIYYYNGSTVTQYSPALGFYSVFEAAPTILETIELAAEKYDVRLPLADLFLWGTPQSNVDNLTIAYFVGETRINGQTCNHFAFRADDVDFQVWIAKRGDPLPCRLVLDATADPVRPHYAATLTWDIDPLIVDSLFSFAPPAGVTEIKQVEVAGGN